MEQNSSDSVPVVKARSVNYAAAVFFTLLLVGFTFHLPTILYIPMIFFTIAAGVIFFKDALATRTIGKKAGPDDPLAKPQKGPKKFVLRLLFWAFAIAGVVVICYIGFIILLLVMFSSFGGGIG